MTDHCRWSQFITLYSNTFLINGHADVKNVHLVHFPVCCRLVIERTG